MILENEFSVRADIDTVWRQLLDMEGVASCLPGATVTATERDNVYDGSMRLKIGPMRVEYRGTATLLDMDEQNHTAVISLDAREAKGQGSAMATIRNRLEQTDSGTRVRAETELNITGPQAQFGRGVIEDVGKRVLEEFSQRLEQRIAASTAGAARGGNPPSGLGGTPAEASSEGIVVAAEPVRADSPGPPAPAAAAELDIGSLLARTRAARVAAAVALLVIALIVLRRRR